MKSRIDVNPLVAMGGGLLCILGGFGIGLLFTRMELLDASYVGTIIGSLASLVGIWLLYLTYSSQKKELRATQRALREQRLDSSFYTRLSMLIEIVNSMEGRLPTPTSTSGMDKFKGREYLHRMLEIVLGEIRKNAANGGQYKMNIETGKLNPYTIVDTKTVEEDGKNFFVINRSVDYNTESELGGFRNFAGNQFKIIYDEYQNNLSHYFRYVSSTISSILNDSKLNYKQRDNYFGILQAQLSDDELGLLFYAGVMSVETDLDDDEDETESFHYMLDESNILYSLSKKSIGVHFHHWFYPETNFQFLTNMEKDEKEDYRERQAAIDEQYEKEHPEEYL